jgi:hypothetical protein
MGGPLTRAFAIAFLLMCLAAAPLIVVYGLTQDGDATDSWCFELAGAAVAETAATEPELLDETNAVFDPGYDAAVREAEQAQANNLEQLDDCLGVDDTFSQD